MSVYKQVSRGWRSVGSKHSKHQKGCPLCKPHKNRLLPQSERVPFAVKRLLGKNKRISRHEVPSE